MHPKIHKDRIWQGTWRTPSSTDHVCRLPGRCVLCHLGSFILRCVGLLALVHEKPLSNTPGIASVGGREEKMPRPICWCRMASHVTKRNAHALPIVVAVCMITVRALSSLCWSLSLCWGGHFGRLHAMALSGLDRASISGLGLNGTCTQQTTELHNS